MFCRSGRSPIKASGHCSQSSFFNSFDLASGLWDTPLSCSNDILAQWPRFLGMCWSMLVGNMAYNTFLVPCCPLEPSLQLCQLLTLATGLTALLNARLQSECIQHIQRTCTYFYILLFSLVLSCYLLLSLLHSFIFIR